MANNDSNINYNLIVLKIIQMKREKKREKETQKDNTKRQTTNFRTQILVVAEFFFKPLSSTSNFKFELQTQLEILIFNYD